MISFIVIGSSMLNLKYSDKDDLLHFRYAATERAGHFPQNFI